MTRIDNLDSTAAGEVDERQDGGIDTVTFPICVACGTQYSAPRADCPVCEDDRQYVPPGGQRWSDLAEFRGSPWTARVEEQGPRLLGVGSDSTVGIGQRALLVKAESGNILWDCVSFLNDDLITRLMGHGGITAIAISHPHYYTTMVEWAHAFDVPVFLHAADRQWVGRPDPRLEFWDGPKLELADGLTLHNAGVHFTGGTVLHWQDAGQPGGALLTGDIIQVIPDRTHVGFMYSYPNLIPERPHVVAAAARMLKPLTYEALHGAWWDSTIPSRADSIVQASARRYADFTNPQR